MKAYTRLFILGMLLGCATVTFAQDEGPDAPEPEVQFSLKPATASAELPQAVVDALNTRVRQILNRNSAAAGDDLNPFVIEPTLTVSDIQSTQGLVQNVTVAKGELTLTAMNEDSGSDFYGKTINLKAEVSSTDREKVLLDLVNSIKVTDPAFVRFIRTARTKVKEYYAERGEPLPRRTAPKTVVVPDTVIREVRDTVVREVRDTVVRVVREPVDNTPANNSAPINAQVSISTKDLSFQVLSCVGDPTLHMITITASIENLTDENHSWWCNFRQAFDPDGNQFSKLKTEQWNSQDFPSRIKVKRGYVIENVKTKVDYLSFVQISIGNTTIEIRNLKIDWK